MKASSEFAVGNAPNSSCCEEKDIFRKNESFALKSELSGILWCVIVVGRKPHPEHVSHIKSSPASQLTTYIEFASGLNDILMALCAQA